MTEMLTDRHQERFAGVLSCLLPPRHPIKKSFMNLPLSLMALR